MCGILGLFSLSGDAKNESRFAEALATLRHRGPNFSDIVRVNSRLLLGHARLSIIDLSHGSDQPMQIDNRYWLVYNGEIFNFLELREELISAGHTFETSGDVEVLLRSYQHWGEQCVDRFNGMWAFAIYDEQDGTLFCSRDRFGIKPFNYALHEGQFLFASEIKAMLHYAPELNKPDYRAMANFCRTSVGAQHERTWFRDVKRLPAGCNLTINAEGNIDIRRYWDYPAQQGTALAFDEACSKYRALFDDAVRLRMRSDVPVGITLSSGIDSTSIAYAMADYSDRKCHSYTASFRASHGLTQDSTLFVDGSKTIDEAVVARKVAAELGFEQTVLVTDYQDFVNELTRVIYHLESGNSAPAVIPLVQLLREASKELTVVMDGQGADELLAGYITTVIWPALRALLMRGDWRAAAKCYREYRQTYTIWSSLSMTVRYATNRAPWLNALWQKYMGLDGLYGPKLSGHKRMRDYPTRKSGIKESPLTRILREQHSGGLANLLHYGDAISMANSLEARMPFLDHRLVEFVWTLPDDYKVRIGVGKALHREAMRGTVPDPILDERAKHGFTSPISRQFRLDEPSGNGPLSLLLSDRCIDRGLFLREGLEKIIDDHRSGRRDHGPLLFRLLSTEIWCRIFLDKGEIPAANTNEPLEAVAA